MAGLQSPLPWQYCGNDHNTRECYNKDMAESCNTAVSNPGGEQPGRIMSYWNNTCTKVEDICSFYSLGHDESQFDRFNFTMCLNGSELLSLDQVSVCTYAYVHAINNLKINFTILYYKILHSSISFFIICFFLVHQLLIFSLQNTKKVTDNLFSDL